MIKFLRLLALGLLLLTGTPLSARAERESSAELLDVLDTRLAETETYVQARYRRIRFLLDMKADTGTSFEQQYQCNRMLYDEYFSFKFDSALYYLSENTRLASAMGDRRRLAETAVEQGLLYTTSGMFLEAREVLLYLTDTLSLDRGQLLHYYWVQHRFNRDFREYSKHSTLAETAERRMAYYRAKLFAELPPDSEEYLSLQVCEAMDEGDMARADSVNALLLARHAPDTHPYAIHAYAQALISYALNRPDFCDWYIRSAIADVMTATKDNASITSLARQLFADGEEEIERAFRYISISMDDAIFYNAKLRPWQIAQIMPVIERSYAKRNAAAARLRRRQNTAIVLFAALSLAFALYAWVLFRRARRTAREIESKNVAISRYLEEQQRMTLQLRELNTSIAEANRVKEEYIGLLLSMCSNYIEKLQNLQRTVKRKLSAGKAAELQKELSSTALMDAELEDFYNMFDGAFLRLYPDFVEEFNSLLKDEERIVLHKGEMLNTELRIFALIRLGISDSSKIAALLRYSVNTIYNYRAKVKNRAKSGREDFEDRIRTIGSFKS